MNKRTKAALNFIFECLETRELSKKQNIRSRTLEVRFIHWL